VTHWKVYIFLVAGFLINFMYFFMYGSDIAETMNMKIVPMLLLIMLEISAYICIFYSLKTTLAEFALKEENLKTEAREVLLQSELSAYDEFIDFSRHYRHDLRHHNAVIREMLSNGDISEALTYLNEFDNSIVETTLKQYCSNPVANAIFRLFENRTQADHVNFVVNANISEALPMTAPELGGLLSNLLENAWVACIGCLEIGRFIAVSADTTENQLFLEVKNSVRDVVRFTDNLPVSMKKGGGTGTKSIMRIVRKHNGMCRFKQMECEFMVQIVLPLG
jgi:sensor histidine kinase regulating citrate/malate metabolism